MAGIKIVDLPPLGRDLASTDLLELSLAGGTGSRKITGQEIMNASKLSINNTPIINGTIGRVLFQGTGDVLQQSSSLFWDATNNRLGIGTSSPFWGLHYNVDGGLNVGMFSSYGTTSTFESLLYLFRSRGTSSAPSPVLSGDNLGSLRFAGQWGSSLNEYTTGAKIEGVATQNFSSSVNSARMSFYTTADGSNAIRENMRLFSSGNLLLQNGGTFTDAGFRLDVNGTARVQGVITGSVPAGSLTLGAASANQTALNILGYFTSNGAIVTSNYNARSFNTNIGAQSVGYGSSYNGNNQSSSSVDSYFLAGGSINITNGTIDLNGFAFGPSITSETNATIKAFSSSLAAASNRWNLYLSGTAKNYIAGNTLIGTTTDDGFKLDVNGTARVQGTLTGVTQYYTTGASATAHFLELISTSTTNGYVNFRRGGGANGTYGYYLNNGVASFNVNNTTGETSLWANSGGFFLTFYSNALERMRIPTSGNVLIGTTTDAGYRLDVNGSARVQGVIETTQHAYLNNGVWCDVYRNRFGVQVFSITLTSNNMLIGTTTDVASAILNVSSTTKGFLPPRMTQAQRNAIASPAIGLEIYQTDATEGKYIYKSSGWTYIG